MLDDLLGCYKVSHDIKVLPKSVRNRYGNYTSLNELVEICDMLKLDSYLPEAVDRILRSSWTHERRSGRDKLLYDECSDKYVGFIKDDSYYLLSDKLYESFVDCLDENGIELNWPMDYLFVVLAGKGLIKLPEYVDKEALTYSDSINGNCGEFIRLMKKTLKQAAI